MTFFAPPPAPQPGVFTQASPADSWLVNHNRGARPVKVQVLTPGFVEVTAGVQHITENQFLVEFASPQIGIVRYL